MEEIPKTLLIVEDDAAIGDILTETFRQVGYAVQLATTGEEGLKAAETFPPSLILLDVLLPRMNGIEMLRQLRGSSWGKAIPVIILSNFSEPEIPKEIKDLGVAECLVKAHMRLHQLISIVGKAIEAKADSSEAQPAI